MYEHISDYHKDGLINSKILFLHLGLKMIKQPYVKEMSLCDDVEFCREDKIGVSIIYAYEDSDVFCPAKLLKHGINCLCFASKEPIAMGEKIYIAYRTKKITESQLLEMYKQDVYARDFESTYYEVLKKIEKVQFMSSFEGVVYG